MMQGHLVSIVSFTDIEIEICQVLQFWWKGGRVVNQLKVAEH
jgi:hypothetical protein